MDGLDQISQEDDDPTMISVEFKRKGKTKISQGDDDPIMITIAFEKG